MGGRREKKKTQNFVTYSDLPAPDAPCSQSSSPLLISTRISEFAKVHFGPSGVRRALWRRKEGGEARKCSCVSKEARSHKICTATRGRLKVQDGCQSGGTRWLYNIFMYTWMEEGGNHRIILVTECDRDNGIRGGRAAKLHVLTSIVAWLSP